MNIYVGNLSFKTTEAELRQLFESFGSVTSVNVIKDRESGRPRGFGFVEMPNAEEAQRAIESINGTSLGGRDLTVNEARPRQDRGDGPPRGGRR